MRRLTFALKRAGRQAGSELDGTIAEVAQEGQALPGWVNTVIGDLLSEVTHQDDVLPGTTGTSR